MQFPSIITIFALANAATVLSSVLRPADSVIDSAVGVRVERIIKRGDKADVKCNKDKDCRGKKSDFVWSKLDTAGCFTDGYCAVKCNKKNLDVCGDLKTTPFVPLCSTLKDPTSARCMGCTNGKEFSGMCTIFNTEPAVPTE